MSAPMIRPARPDEYDEVARVWMESWVSTGLEDASKFLLAQLRARVPREIENGWSLFVADDGGALAAMLALHRPKRYLDSFSSHRPIRATRSAGNCSASRGAFCLTKSICAACGRTKRRGDGMSARVFCSKKSRLSRSPGGR